MLENVLKEIDTLNNQPLEQFIHLSHVLKNMPGKLFDSKLISTHPPDIKLRINFGTMGSLLDECMMNLVTEGTSYMVDKNKTIYVHIDNMVTLRVMTRILHKFIINKCEFDAAEEQLVEPIKRTKKYRIHLAS